MKWLIETGDVVAGIYEADTREEALEIFARDAGYESAEQMRQETAHLPGDVRIYAWEDLDPATKECIQTQHPDLF